MATAVDCAAAMGPEDLTQPEATLPSTGLQPALLSATIAVRLSARDRGGPREAIAHPVQDRQLQRAAQAVGRPTGADVSALVLLRLTLEDV